MNPIFEGTRQVGPLRLLVFFVSLAAAGCVGRPPHAFRPRIAEEYYLCDKCQSLHGGIYGKGPIASFAKDDGARCWHRWRPTSKAEFQQQAETRFPNDWAKALPFFKLPAKP